MHFNYKIKYLIIITFLIMGYLFLLINGFPEDKTLCIFKNLTGIPCPACGSTRATLLLFHGEIRKSLLLNPFGLVTNIIIIISIAWMAADIIKKRETFLPFLKTDWNIWVKITLLIIILINWIWNISKGL